MTMAEDDISTVTPRSGSGADLSRRMERMEARQDTIEGKVNDLAAIVTRVELNQQHATELATLRFNAVDTAVHTIDATLERFMGRINAIVAGEVKLPQAVQSEEIVKDFIAWRKTVDERISQTPRSEWREQVEDRLDKQDIRNGRLDLLGKLAVMLLGSNLLAIIGAIAAFLSK